MISMKNAFTVFTGLVLTVMVLLSCEKKGDANAIKPDYGATGNPNPDNQTVTGSTTYTNPATKNSALIVGDFGWSNPTCGSTFSLALKANDGATDVILSFSSVITTH